MASPTNLKILKEIKNQYINNPITPPKTNDPYIDVHENNGHRSVFIFTQGDNPKEYKLVDSKKLSASLNDYPTYNIYRLLQQFELLRYDNREDDPKEFYIDHFKLEDKISELQQLALKKWGKIGGWVITTLIALIGLLVLIFPSNTSDQSTQIQESLLKTSTSTPLPKVSISESSPEAPISESISESQISEPLPEILPSKSSLEAPISESLPEAP